MVLDKSLVAVIFLGVGLLLSLYLSFISNNEIFGLVVTGTLGGLLTLIDPKGVLKNDSTNP